jgi:Domain of Unknown Function (DUF928)
MRFADAETHPTELMIDLIEEGADSMQRFYLNWPKMLVLLTIGALGLMGVSPVSRAVANPANGFDRGVFQVSQGFSWGDLMRILAPPRRSGSSRDASVCVLSIDQSPSARNVVASLNPTLAWKGGAKSVGLRSVGETKPFWERAITFSKGKGIQQVRYSGTPLMPGGEYELVIVGTVGQTIANFTVLSAVDRATLAQKLAPLTGSDEATLQQRVTIYSESGLRADGLAELLKVRKPSVELQQELTRLPVDRCPRPTEVEKPAIEKPI